MLTGVTVSCFLLSYLVVLAMEASRFVMKVPGRNALLIAMFVAGLAAHSIFLVNQFLGVSIAADQPFQPANWFQWSVLGAWGLAFACLGLMIRNPNASIGLYLIPLILGLIGLGQLLRGWEPFHPQTTLSVWGSIHGVSLLIGTMFICFGLAFGVMYLVQSYRLKTKKQPSVKFRLPTLEFLQSMNRLSLFTTTGALAIGLASGIMLSFYGQGQIAWFSGGILFSFALFAVALVASGWELISGGSLGGRRSAYLTIANFVFMVIVLGLVLYASHGQIEPTGPLGSASLRSLDPGAHP